jgi:uncharacterized damage-inducible protein DinB
MSSNISSNSITELLHGIGAHADPLGCIEDVSSELASRHVDGFPHSIRDLLFHMNYWMDYELRRIRGRKPVYPEHSSESFPAPNSPVNSAEWERLKLRFAELLVEFAALAQSPEPEMRRQIESARAEDLNRSGTLEAVIWQMVAHNSYHAGQIVVLRQMLGAWPPPAGGDSW